jgi:cytoskeletal protein RodZ
MNDSSATPVPRAGSKPDLPQDPPPQASDVGTLLCATRMRLGKDLQEIAGVLHIRYNFLVAIEDGRYEDLPGQAYAIGFVRAYADHLGLDGDEVVRRYKEETAGIKRKVRYEYPISAPETGIPSGALLLISVVLGMVVYGVWYSMADADRRAAEVIQEVPERLAALLDRPVTAPEPQAPEPQAPEPTGAPANDAGTEDSESAVVADSIAVETPAPDEAAMPAAPAAPAVSVPVQNPRDESTAVVAAARPESLPPSAAPASSPSVESAARPALSPSAAPAPPVSQPPTTPAAAPPAGSAKPIAAQPESSPPPAPGVSGVKPQGVVAANSAAPSPVAPPRSPEPRPAQTSAAPPQSPAQPSRTIPSAAAGKDAIELRAKSDSWIQIRDGEQLLLTRFLRKGEAYRVPDRAGLTLMTLNAGGIDVLVNGETMPPLGEPGSVARGVALDAQKLKANAPSPPAQPAPAAPN